jgi:hypothetical protein
LDLFFFSFLVFLRVYYKATTLLYFFFSTSCSAASLVLFARMLESGIGTGHAKASKGFEVLLCDGPGFLLFEDVLPAGWPI